MRTVRVGIVIGIAAMLAAALSGYSGVGQETKRPSGYWAYVDVTRQGTPDNQVLEAYPARITGEAGKLHSTHSALDGQRVRWSQEADWTWESPPASLKAGDPLTMRLTRERLTFTGGDPGYGRISVDISHVDSEFGTRALERFFDAEKRYDLKLAAPGKVSVDFTGNVLDPDAFKGRPRPGAEGIWMSVRVVVDHGRALAFYYNYRWTEGSPPPADGKSGTGGTGTETSVGSAGGNISEPADVKEMTLQAAVRRARPGETVQVPVWLLKSGDVANMNFGVAYKASVATPASTSLRGNLLGSALFETNPAVEGEVLVGFAQNTGIVGSGTVATLPFKAVGKPGDRTDLTLNVPVINNPSGAKLPIRLIHGAILIVGEDGLVPGDCDGDGSLSAADAKCALQMSVRLRPESLHMDMEKDGRVTSNDARLILDLRTGRGGRTP